MGFSAPAGMGLAGKLRESCGDEMSESKDEEILRAILQVADGATFGEVMTATMGAQAWLAVYTIRDRDEALAAVREHYEGLERQIDMYCNKLCD